MVIEQLFNYLLSNKESVLKQTTPEASETWKKFLELHPADRAQFLEEVSKQDLITFFAALPPETQQATFEHLRHQQQKILLQSINDQPHKMTLLNALPIDHLTDLFEELSDDDLKQYLYLLNVEDRKKVLSLMQFGPETAGGLMDIEVLTLRADVTVGKSVHILQRIRPRIDLHQLIYVTDQQHTLLGHIRLEDLVLTPPHVRVQQLLRKNDLVIYVDEDREKVAQQMVHYHLMTAPVVDRQQRFLGIISSETLVTIIEEEASEDLYKVSAMAPIKRSYFETPFVRLLYERSSILILLLLAQSLSTFIIDHYAATLSGFLMLFITMLISTGGNSSSQTSALVIQGLASGELHEGTIQRFIFREFKMAAVIAVLLAFFGFIRVYFLYGNLMGSIAVSFSLALIVMTAVALGSCMPILLRKANIDPAFAAGPFLATIMDIFGLLIYCAVGYLILG